MIPPNYCPLHKTAQILPKAIAVYTQSEAITYRQLDTFIHKSPDLPSVFAATPTLDSIVQIFSLLRKGHPICPLSPRLKNLQTPPLPRQWGFCLQTSGTTGTPKYVLLSVENFLHQAQYPHPSLRLQPGDVWSLSLPLNHVSGLSILFRAFSAGAAVALPDSLQPYTHTSWVPTQLQRAMTISRAPNTVKWVLMGGAPLPLDMCKQATTQGYPLILSYGMTETTSHIVARPFSIEDQEVYLGFPLPGRKIQIIEGQIYVKGKTLFQGYLGQALQQGWFNTHDRGVWTEQGLKHLGRSDRMIISGGENIDPQELEQAFLSLEGVIKTEVTARPDPEYGMRPVAHIVVAHRTNKEDLLQKLQLRLPKYQLPNIEDITLQQG